MSNTKVSKNRKIGALIAYTTLACSLVSLGVYVYRQQSKAGSNRTSRAGDDHSSNQNSRQNLGNNTAATQSDSRSTEQQASSLSRLGSKIARTVKKNRKVMTISLKNTIVWNPSPDPTTPNYGFVEGTLPLLFYLAENYNLHLILLCPPPQQLQTRGKERELTIQEQDEMKQQQQLGQEREREQILTMLRNAGLISSGGGPKLIDPRQLLICETEEGVGHVVRHLESQIHVESRPAVVEMVQGVVPKVVVVQKKTGRSRAPSTADDVMTRSHVRVRSSSRSSSAGSIGSEDSGNIGSAGVNGTVASPESGAESGMGDSFVEVVRPAPLVSGYVNQAGKRGYVEVTDQLQISTFQS
ncbi:hypothetical protein BGZ94_008865 [Podila epigama]|nr:hypothetical protein BGZ94_008865 [Podila epigama]